MDADWYAFCQAIYKGTGVSEWEDLYHHHREMSKAAGAKKPSESHKANALWAMKAAKDRGDEFNDSAWKDKKTDKTGVVGRTSQRPHHRVGQSFEVRGESVSRLIVGSRLL